MTISTWDLSLLVGGRQVSENFAFCAESPRVVTMDTWWWRG